MHFVKYKSISKIKWCLSLLLIGNIDVKIDRQTNKLLCTQLNVPILLSLNSDHEHRKKTFVR